VPRHIWRCSVAPFAHSMRSVLNATRLATGGGDASSPPRSNSGNPPSREGDSSPGASVLPLTAAELAATNAALQSELTALKAQLKVATERAGFKSGTLYKYRPWAEGVFADPWARRFLSLIGNTLMSYRSEHDVAHLPRSTVTLDEHCTIQASRSFTVPSLVFALLTPPPR
jgi:hypothetical protein